MTHSEAARVVISPPAHQLGVVISPPAGVTRTRRAIVIPGRDVKPEKRPWGRPRRDIPVNEYVEGGEIATMATGKPASQGGEIATSFGTVPLDFVPEKPAEGVGEWSSPLSRPSTLTIDGLDDG